MNSARRVLVTGGCGFLGRALVPELVARGHEVVVADNLSNPLSIRLPDFPFFKLDMADPTSAAKAFEGVDACIALASAWGALGFAHRNPAGILGENGRIAVSTFEAAAEAGIDRIVFVSTSLVYENCRTFPTPESELLEAPAPQAPFAISKLIGEACAYAYRDQYDLPYTIIRPSNIYSADEHPAARIGDAHVIPDLILKIRSGQRPLELFGGGQQRRCFVHARDLARGVADALESDRAVGEDINLSGDDDISILELARLLWELCQVPEEFDVVTTAGFTHDLARSYPDNTKAKRLLGWEPRVPLREGLSEVVSAVVASGDRS